ncbi:bifunctional (p)ppGpp synthetase/guanosine-3',5'-bis(diphosphate) 3'-pyrophosphohydrolase [Actinomadura darangshiensis]|uniref:Bifunctional (P)ppGpp synthetase/guanosine-3',5'-bis(Diphosphate) 3'-pyrophosphohydrolase n=1 Tax=Actinomadura darangshiensis TaxID=705336 RepID=A0A4V6PEV0_9ACTN|nr:HD domain-containing protein [Actinomadura darangshiensis]TDD82007.1 bifunctional (p)ppGpp synthetase/guanosine-3',5'-bis(diphosphate) 3'-pyrophosphohydrolase [Actinomadura darangshiensis]
MEVFTRWHTWDTARAGIVASGAPIDLDALGKAVAAAQRWHGGQERPTGAPYVEHLLEALEVLVRGADVTVPAVLYAAVLHDVVEDTSATLSDVEDEFGPEVTELVDWVTKPPAVGTGRQAKRAAKSAYLRRLRDAPREAILVKLADRVSNVQTLDRMPPDFQRRYYAETLTYIVPLAEPEPWFQDWYASWRRHFAHLQ